MVALTFEIIPHKVRAARESDSDAEVARRYTVAESMSDEVDD